MIKKSNSTIFFCCVLAIVTYNMFLKMDNTIVFCLLGVYYLSIEIEKYKENKSKVNLFSIIASLLIIIGTFGIYLVN